MKQIRLAKSLRQRFDEKWIVEPNSGCHLWFGHVDERGRGMLRINRRLTFASRVSWTIHRGPIPEGIHVLHRCDTPMCVNPRHLFLGTHDDNMRDMAVKGRHANVAGQRNAAAKLTDADVRAIRSSTETQMTLAARFQVSQATISDVRRLKKWRGV